ncbi:MAG: SusE domain-containing protein [Saprospiraceae bacterium]|nr:SusE domain-containing protein [Saprospiraceae bacterium]
MKKILSLSLGVALLLSACTEKDKEPILAAGNAPQITSPANGASIVLAESTAGELASIFSWTAAEFGFQAGVNYTLELDKAGNNFGDPITVGSINALELDNVTQEKLNNILIAGKDLPAEEFSNVEFRVVARIGTAEDLPVLVSSTVTIQVRPYTVVINYPFLHVPGSYQGWNPADSTTVVYAPRSDEKYEGYLYYSDGDAKYKFTKGPTWSNNWGDNDNDGSLEPSGADIPLPSGAGVYRINADLNALTHAAVRTDWGLIGSATPGGWDSDQTMTYDQASRKWLITLDLVPGDIKFRANDAWDINLGDNDANRKMEYGGANIAIAEAGNYTIELNLSVPIYTYKITKN